MSNIHEAAKSGDLKALDKFLKDGDSVDEPGSSGFTPLIWAAICNKPDAVKFLIARKANLNLQNNLQNTALIYAARNGYDGCVKLLLDAQADITQSSISVFVILLSSAAAITGRAGRSLPAAFASASA